jgi:hypothetical protein
MISSTNITISQNNREYAEAFELIVKEKEAELMKYEKSVLWSPVYTPKHFKYMFLLPAFFVALLILYIRYIAQPKLLLKYKKKYGISLKEFEKRGWMDSWMDEYQRPDEVLTFEAYSVKDLELLYKEGLLKGGSSEQQKEQEQRATKRKNKFVSGSKDFVLKEFNST